MPLVLGAVVASALLYFHQQASRAAAPAPVAAQKGAPFYPGDTGGGGSVGTGGLDANKLLDKIYGGSLFSSDTGSSGGGASFGPGGGSASYDLLSSSGLTTDFGSPTSSTSSGGTPAGGGSGGYTQPFSSSQLLLNAQAREAPTAEAPVGSGGKSYVA